MQIDSTVSTPAPRAAARRTIDDLPGPPGLPLLGNLLQVNTARMHLQVEEWSRQYGPLFTFGWRSATSWSSPIARCMVRGITTTSIKPIDPPVLKSMVITLN